MSTALGTDIRTLRKHRQMTLKHVAEALGRSVGWMSQVERGLSKPERQDLEQMAKLFKVPQTMITSQVGGAVVKEADRRPLPDRAPGLRESLLSPDLTDDFEVIHSVFSPKASRQGIKRGTQELAYIISGRLEVVISGEEHSLNAGDAMRLRGDHFSWSNPYDEPAVAIWVIAPPIY